MNRTRTGTAVAVLALTAATVAVAPAHASPAAPAQTGVAHYVAQGVGSADDGSLDNPIVGAGVVLLAGVGVSIALAVSAGIAGGALDLPQIPGIPF